MPVVPPYPLQHPSPRPRRGVHDRLEVFAIGRSILVISAAPLRQSVPRLRNTCQRFCYCGNFFRCFFFSFSSFLFFLASMPGSGFLDSKPLIGSIIGKDRVEFGTIRRFGERLSLSVCCVERCLFYLREVILREVLTCFFFFFFFYL